MEKGSLFDGEENRELRALLLTRATGCHEAFSSRLHKARMEMMLLREKRQALGVYVVREDRPWFLQMLGADTKYIPHE